jgi:hypothetical protein
VFVWTLALFVGLRTGAWTRGSGICAARSRLFRLRGALLRALRIMQAKGGCEGHE